MIEVSIVFCRYGVGGLPNVVERPKFSSIEDAIYYLKGKQEVCEK